MSNYLYVLLDPTSNHVTTRGVGLKFLTKAMKKLPRNIVLLSGAKAQGSFDDYTRFEVIRGEKSVGDFINCQEFLPLPTVKWVDYDSQELFHQLTPGEIAEMLYLAHANRHWHSPFFYKLQNNYVCLPMENQLVKIYYRYINEFYYQLALSFKRCLQLQRRPEKRSIFFLNQVAMPKQKIQEPSVYFIKSLLHLLYEGVIFDFSQAYATDKTGMHIPVYLAEDQVDETMRQLTHAKLMATITYSRQGEWVLSDHSSNAIFGG